MGTPIAAFVYSAFVENGDPIDVSPINAPSTPESAVVLRSQLVSLEHNTMPVW